MRRIIILLLLLSCIVSGYGQTITKEALSSTGITSESSGYLLSWNVGELCTECISGGSNMLTQGFYQGKLMFIGLNDLQPLSAEIEIFPNPADEYVSFNFPEEINPHKKYHVSILSLEGRLLYESENISSNQRIPLSFLCAGTYIMYLRDGKQFNHYKIIKNQ